MNLFQKSPMMGNALAIAAALAPEENAGATGPGRSAPTRTAFADLIDRTRKALVAMNRLELVYGNFIPRAPGYESARDAAQDATLEFLELAELLQDTPAPTLAEVIAKMKFGEEVNPELGGVGNAIDAGFEWGSYMAAGLRDLERIVAGGDRRGV